MRFTHRFRAKSAIRSAFCLVASVVVAAATPRAAKASWWSTSAAPAAGTEPAWRYRVRVEPGDTPRVHVTLDVSGLSPEQSKLSLTMIEGFAFARLPKPLLEGPVRAYASDRSDSKHVADRRELKVESKGAYSWEVATEGATAVRVEYTIPVTHRSDPRVRERDAYEYPYLADDHGMLVTATMIIRPGGAWPGRATVAFDLPEGWAVATPWKPVGERTFEVDDENSLVNDLIAVGAWRSSEVRVGDYYCTIAIAPGQEALETAVVEPTRRIVEAELKLFGREPRGRFMFLFGRPDMRGLAGSPKTRSMTLTVEPTLATAAAKYLSHLIAHEFYHTWGGEPVALPDELRWIAEGFTDYYAFLVSARQGLISWEQFGEEIAKKIELYSRLMRERPMSLVEAGGPAFFAGKEAYDLTYAGGTLVAAWLDRALRNEYGGKSLDKFMRAFMNDERWHSAGARPTMDDFVAAVRAYGGEKIAERLHAFASKAGEFEPAHELSGVGAATKREARKAKVELRANLDGTKIKDIDPASLAFLIGLRQGDELVECNGIKVTTPKETHAAWAKIGEDGRIRAVAMRGTERIFFDEAIPQVDAYSLEVERWKEDLY